MAQREKWDAERIKAAIEGIRNKEMGGYKAFRVFSIPQTALEHYVQDQQKSSSETIKTKLGNKQVLPCEAEICLAEHCLLVVRKFFGLTMADVMCIAYQLAVRNGIKTSFAREMKRLSRVRGFTPESVAQFFEIYKPAVDTIQHNPARLYNCDETGITIIQHKHTKISGLKGKHQISSLQSAELRSLVTLVTCMSPSGHFIPLLLVFPRKNMKQELMNGTMPGSIHVCHPSGWIQNKIFFPVVSSFHQTYKADNKDPVILVLDRHYSHTRNLEVITLAQENHVESICLPPHSSHKMQPLDKVFMGPLKTFCCQ